MRIQTIFFTCLTLLASHPLPILAQPISSETNAPIIWVQQTQQSALAQWELAFQEYTWNDGTFVMKIPSSCPVERAGAKCCYPKPKVNVERDTQNEKPHQIISISGGSYEVVFNFQVIEISGITTDANSQKSWLQDQVQGFRNKIEAEGGGNLVSFREITVNGHKGMELTWQGERY